MATIGDRLGCLIRGRGMFQKEFAQEFGLKVSTLNGYVNNYRVPSLEMQKKFADFFNVSIDYLVGRTKDTNSEDDYYKIPDEIYSFISDPQNKKYIQHAIDLKNRGIEP